MILLTWLKQVWCALTETSSTLCPHIFTCNCHLELKFNTKDDITVQLVFQNATCSEEMDRQRQNETVD